MGAAQMLLLSYTRDLTHLSARMECGTERGVRRRMGVAVDPWTPELKLDSWRRRRGRRGWRGAGRYQTAQIDLGEDYRDGHHDQRYSNAMQGWLRGHHLNEYLFGHSQERNAASLSIDLLLSNKHHPQIFLISTEGYFLQVLYFAQECVSSPWQDLNLHIFNHNDTRCPYIYPWYWWRFPVLKL